MPRHGEYYDGPFPRNAANAKRNRRIKQLVTRKRNRLTQCEVADQFGISQPAVSQIVRNRNATVVSV